MPLTTSLHTKVINGFGLAIDTIIDAIDDELDKLNTPIDSNLHAYGDVFKLLNGLDTKPTSLKYYKFNHEQIEKIRETIHNTFTKENLNRLIKSPVDVYLPKNIETGYIYYPAINPIGESASNLHFADENEAKQKLCQDLANITNLLAYVISQNAVPKTFPAYNQFNPVLKDIIVNLVTANADYVADLDLDY